METTQIQELLEPQIAAEASARSFYEAARTWARRKGYPGAERQFSCYVHYHKHDLKMILNIFADWDIDVTMPAVESPGAVPEALPDVLDASLAIETKLMGEYNTISQDLFEMNVSIYDSLRKVQKKQTKYFQEINEFVERLKLMNVNNGLDLVYFDRKVLKWPSR